jgi:AraC family transcriptional regulator
MTGSTILRDLSTHEYSLRVVRYAPHHRMPVHAHDEHGISVLLDGEIVEEAEHRTVSASAGWVVNKPPGVYHANRFGGEGAMMIAITLSPTTDLAPRRWNWKDDPVATAAALKLIGSSQDPEALTEAIATLADDSADIADPAWVRRLKRQLDDGSNASVASLAREAGVHPVSLTRAFHRRYGLSIRAYRTQQQVRRAVQLAAGTSLPLSRVAHDAGFADHSHMCRAFRAVTGWNPGRLRDSGFD